jgi:hypothetical protein
MKSVQMAEHDRNAISTIMGVVENSTSTGVRIEGVWYTLPRDLAAPPPDRGARVELTVAGRHFVRGLRTLEPAPAPAEADRALVRASVLRSAARFAGTHTEPPRSTDTLELAAAFEAWVYRPVIREQDDGHAEFAPDRERRVKRESALSSVVEFLANKPDARPEHILVLAAAWERWLARAHEENTVCESCGQALDEAVFPNGTSWSVAELAAYGRERHGRALCQACFTASQQALTPGSEASAD